MRMEVGSFIVGVPTSHLCNDASKFCDAMRCVYVVEVKSGNKYEYKRARQRYGKIVYT